jgi:hypothetical protein
VLSLKTMSFCTLNPRMMMHNRFSWGQERMCIVSGAGGSGIPAVVR